MSINLQGIKCGDNMKKLIYLGSFVILVLCLTGCNKQVFDFKYTYDKAVCNYDGDKFTLEIDKWNDYEGEQLQVISNGETYLISANKCYLIKD